MKLIRRAEGDNLGGSFKRAGETMGAEWDYGAVLRGWVRLCGQRYYLGGSFAGAGETMGAEWYYLGGSFMGVAETMGG